MGKDNRLLSGADLPQEGESALGSFWFAFVDAVAAGSATTLPARQETRLRALAECLEVRGVNCSWLHCGAIHAVERPFQSTNTEFSFDPI